MKTKSLALAALIAATTCAIPMRLTATPTPSPAPKHSIHLTGSEAKKAGLTPATSTSAPKHPIHLTASEAKKAGLTSSPAPKHPIHLTASEAKKAGLTSTPKLKHPIHLTASEAKKAGLTPTTSTPSLKHPIHLTASEAKKAGLVSPGGSGSPAVPPSTGPIPSYPGSGSHPSHDIGSIVIVPIVLPSAGAYVETVPGQIVLPPGSQIPQSVGQMEVETRKSGRIGHLDVQPEWSGTCGADPASNVNLKIQAGSCQPNHHYGVAIYSGDTTWSRNPLPIGTLQTDGAGNGYQEIQYGCSAWFPTLNFSVGLYELDGENLIAGPMVEGDAGKLGCPRAP